MATKAPKAQHSSRRRSTTPGVPVPRKLYPYVPQKQQQSSAGKYIANLIAKNRAAIENDLNKPGNVDNMNRLSHTKASGSYKRGWATKTNNALSPSKIGRLAAKSGMTRASAKRSESENYLVHGGQDPHRK